MKTRFGITFDPLRGRFSFTSDLWLLLDWTEYVNASKESEESLLSNLIQI